MTLWKQVTSLKLKEVPEFLKSKATVKNATEGFHSWVADYHQKHIVTSSAKPLNDLLIYVGIGAYAIAWPTELKHLKHAEAAAKHGGDHH